MKACTSSGARVGVSHISRRWEMSIAWEAHHKFPIDEKCSEECDGKKRWEGTNLSNFSDDDVEVVGPNTGLKAAAVGESCPPPTTLMKVDSVGDGRATMGWAEGRARAERGLALTRCHGERANELGLEGSRLQLLAVKVMHGYLIHGGGVVVVVVLGSMARPTRSPESSHHGIAQQPQFQTKI
ncbi:hypothetical protein FCULG_00010879 [Fusarium culmorum]|uniref:Uncharacterized protein n=1 Tax=Fusarium culmorum TaxID=5516 RepID=A0A2T4GYS1_FUSCU|nr:hypothetical protein FCULG_00010879 [Fusarium culmorum]